jgi:glyoxylase-like metal-dependent hydrolase (beta-lactamase superfamily II)
MTIHFKDEFETDHLKVIRHCIGPLAVNTYILICKRTRDAAVIDPGGESETIASVLKAEDVKTTHMLFTHAHIDHIYGAEALKSLIPGAKVTYHPLEADVVASIPSMCRMFGMEIRQMPAMEIDLEKTPEFSVGALQLRSLLTPGHTPGSVCFYIPEHQLMFTGDLLFKGSVGRTDFEGGSGFELRKSLDRILEIIPDDVQILPGHGKYTKMGIERTNNFYLKVDRWR